MHDDADAKRLFEALVREHAGSLSALLHAALDDKHAVDDLFQETCVVAWRQLGTFDQTRSFGPWLRGIARNLLLAHGRRRRLVLAGDQIDYVEAHLAEFDRGPGDTYGEKLEALRECLNRLPDKYRRALEIRYLDSRSAADAAAGLDLSLEAVKKRLLRARSLMRDCLARRGLIHPGS